jgi:hypothetical protein
MARVGRKLRDGARQRFLIASRVDPQQDHPWTHSIRSRQDRAPNAADECT